MNEEKGVGIIGEVLKKDRTLLFNQSNFPGNDIGLILYYKYLHSANFDALQYPWPKLKNCGNFAYVRVHTLR